MDTEFIEWFATLGIGGILAAFMFVFYRKDVQMYTTLWKDTANMLMGVIKDNTTSNTKLISLIESMERNTWRKDDIEIMIDRKIIQQRKNDSNN